MNQEQYDQAMLKRHEMIEKYGYIIDQVFGYDVEAKHDFGPAVFFNTHTHGLREAFNHPELQMILPVGSQIVMMTIHKVVDDYIRAGKSLTDGQVIKNPFDTGYDIFVKHHRQLDEDGNEEEYMRLMIPDRDNKIPSIEGEPDSLFAYQRENIFPFSGTVTE